jgi:hypothetical protein
MEISWLAFSCLFRGALFGDASSPHSARASFDRGFQGLVKLGMGPDCDHVRPRPRPADRVGKGFLRYAENRGLLDVR